MAPPPIPLRANRIISRLFIDGSARQKAREDAITWRSFFFVPFSLSLSLSDFFVFYCVERGPRRNGRWLDEKTASWRHRPHCVPQERPLIGREQRRMTSSTVLCPRRHGRWLDEKTHNDVINVSWWPFIGAFVLGPRRNGRWWRHSAPFIGGFRCFVSFSGLSVLGAQLLGLFAFSASFSLFFLLDAVDGGVAPWLRDRRRDRRRQYAVN